MQDLYTKCMSCKYIRNAPINVKPHYPPCGQHRGICGDLHFRFIKSPPTGRVQKIQSPANRQVELTILEKNVAKLYLCGRRSPNTEAQRFIELPDKIWRSTSQYYVLQNHQPVCTHAHMHADHGMSWLLIPYPLGEFSGEIPLQIPLHCPHGG